LDVPFTKHGISGAQRAHRSQKREKEESARERQFPSQATIAMWLCQKIARMATFPFSEEIAEIIRGAFASDGKEAAE
jgi:hypothetical protein